MHNLSAHVDAQVEVQQGPFAEAFVQGLPPAASILADAHLPSLKFPLARLVLFANLCRRGNPC
jgi:hypothetical protein